MLPQGWVETTLGHIAAFNPKHKSDLLPESNVSFVPMSAIDEHSGKIVESALRKYKEVSKGYTHFSDGDVIFAKITPCMENGKVAIAQDLVNGLACGSTEFFVFRPEGIEASLLWYYLRQPSFRKDAETHMTGAVGQRRVPRIFLENHSIGLPPLAEQRRIVTKLDSLTARIARARAELERVRTLSFRAWKSAINQSFQKFKCDNVPLKQIAQITGGLTKNAKRSSLPLQVPYLRVANVYANELRLSDVAEIGCSEKEYKKTKLERNDLLIVEGNGSIDQVGRAARWNGEIDGCTHQNHLIRIRPYESMLSDFLLFFLESSLGRKYIETSASSTSGLHTLSISKIGNFLCPLPSRPLQDLTVKYLNLCRDRLSKKQIEIDRALALLDRLESSLLVKAFRGELVPQDPNDEPASVLLDRIRAERAADPKPKRGRKQSTQDMPLPRKRQTEKHD